MMATAALSAFINDLNSVKFHHFSDYWDRIAAARAEQGAHIDDLLRAIFLGEQLLDDLISQQFANDIDLRLWWMRQLHEIINDGALTLARVFTIVRERQLREQDAQIRQLSTPIIPLHTGILVLPLVGTVDSSRAGQILETLLTGIAAQQAEVVIIDITGVPMVDTDVAHHLLQSARAAALLGAQVVLVGISPEIAQTLTHLGADLSQLPTRANLQAGLDYAFASQGLKLVQA